MSGASVEKFSIGSDASSDLGNLHARLRDTRWPEPAPPEEPWATRIHVVHQRAADGNGIPLILTHGWSSAFVEYLPILPLLTNPRAHGIEGPAFDVVIPSLPDYGLSERSPYGGLNYRAVARLWRSLMNALGYERYGVGGSDFGSGGAYGDVDARFSRDFLLTVITLYWTTGTITSSMRDYVDNRRHPVLLEAHDHVDVPTVVAVFGDPAGDPPREWAERLYNVRRWTPMPRGGHFAAVEEPELLARDIVAFFSDLEQQRASDGGAEGSDTDPASTPGGGPVGRAGRG